MYSYMSSYDLKRNAKRYLIENVGTVIGAFLLRILCIMPFMYGMLYFKLNSVFMITLYFVANVVRDIYSSVFDVGYNYIGLSIYAGQPTVINDLFYGLKGQIPKIAGIRIIPAILKTAIYIPLSMAYDSFAAFSQSMDVESLMNMYMSGDFDGVTKVLEDVIPLEMFILGLGIIYIFVSEIIALLFSQTLYLMVDYDNKNIGEIIALGIKVMKGNWGRYFYLQCSFILWDLLSMLTFYISEIYVYPYKKLTYSGFYMDLMKNYSLTQTENIN